MSFWNLSDNDDATKTTGEYETGGGDDMEPIPAKTQVLAAPDEAKWDEYEGDYYISLRWNVLKPDQYKGRKVFHKLRVQDSDTKKADKAKRMLAAIDANAGGHLAKSAAQPGDAELAKSLVNKPMMLLLQVWEVEKEDGTTATGNWVSAVSPKKSNGGSTQLTQPAQQAVPTDNFDDDIPW